MKGKLIVSALFLFVIFISFVAGAQAQMLDKISATVIYLH